MSPEPEQTLRLEIAPNRPTPPHDSAHTHVRGASEFIDDRPPVAGELHVGVVFSPHAHARVLKIDTSRVAEGATVLTARDLAHNLWGTIFQDQPLLADDLVRFVGEPVAVVAAPTKHAMEVAKRAVRVDYEVLPAIRTIAEARAQGSAIGVERKIERGDVDAAISAAPNTLAGTLVIQGQDHFYLESQAAIAYPQDDRIEVHASSQHPTEVQHVVAHALGLPANMVTVVVRRMGGGFGGKESQAAPFAAFAALVAQRTGRAARLVLTKDDDMIMTGKRNPFEIAWRVGFDERGRLLGLEARHHSNGGAFADLSTSIMERAMLHTDNAYFLPAARITGLVCRTNEHPHTAFRGFGGPKGVAVIEAIMEQIAHHLGLDALDVRRANVYRAGFDTTPYGQTVENNLLPGLFDALEARCDYRQRREAIARHNQTSRTTRRGLSLTAVKFGISFTTRFLNQGNALVNVHQDGTVQVSTGATEMGQGVNQRIATVVAEVFGIPLAAVRVMPTSTEKNHNTSPTAASAGTDLNAKAAQLAAERIRERLANVAAQLLALPPERRPSRTAGLGTEVELDPRPGSEPPELDFVDGQVRLRGEGSSLPFAALCREAYLSRVQLGDYGFFRIPGIHYDKLTGQGHPFFYFTQGVAASEVELDRFTGETKVQRVDILMDLGAPINAGLDLGQVTGAFIQGMGWVTTENLVYDERGLLVSHSPSTYKIPSVQDTPRVFNVELVENPGNTQNVRGTKAVGEPPLLLGLSVWTAIHDALRSPGAPWTQLGIPATTEQVMLAMHRQESRTGPA